ncbi:hypothetical protein DYB30_012708 [Aphanomyces astaci]|uniref:Uncharacterized protein n=1 Tax=Aphanomyces astaci TaxID=112090 RepID=A0A397DGQ3_APHAT|nr:hypothetical protein DYB30_012708 [Aphanomyces astaci]
MKDNTGAATSPTTANATAVLSMSSRKAKRSRALALALVDNNNRKTLLLDEASTPTVCSSTDCMLSSSDAALVATAEAQSKRGLESNNNDEFGSHVLGKRAFVHGLRVVHVVDDGSGDGEHDVSNSIRMWHGVGADVTHR